MSMEKYGNNRKKARLLPAILVALLVIGVGFAILLRDNSVNANAAEHAQANQQEAPSAAEVIAAEPAPKDDVEEPVSAAVPGLDATSVPEIEPASVPETVTAQVSENEPAAVPEDSYFEVRFLDVGEGDASLVLCDGHSMLIDGGSSSASQLIFTVLKEEGIEHLDYIVATHPDSDHIGGLFAALQNRTVGIAYGLGEEKDTRSYNSLVEKLSEQGKSFTVPDAGDAFDLGSATVTVLAPKKGELYSDNTSLVLRVCFGETSFLFMGDSEEPDENALLNYGPDIKSTVLKVGHHGSYSSTSESFLNTAQPEYAVISVGKNNTYGHPSQTILDRLNDAGCKLYRTDLQGTIICSSDGAEVSFSVSRNPDANVFAGTEDQSVLAMDPTVPDAQQDSARASGPEAPDAVTYVANCNPNSLKFHRPDCESVSKMSEDHKIFFYGPREEVIAAGYTPCKICNP